MLTRDVLSVNNYILTSDVKEILGQNYCNNIVRGSLGLVMRV